MTAQECREKNHPESHSFLDIVLPAAYQFTCDSNLCGVCDHGVNSLSMSASSELEPGSSWCWPGRNLKLRDDLGIQKISRELQALARAVGWGGFTSG